MADEVPDLADVEEEEEEEDEDEEAGEEMDEDDEEWVRYYLIKTTKFQEISF